LWPFGVGSVRSGDAHWDSTPVSDSKTDAKFTPPPTALAPGLCAAVKYTVTAYTNYVAAGDFNGDGYPIWFSRPWRATQ